MLGKFRNLIKNPEYFMQYSRRTKRLANLLGTSHKTIEQFFVESEECWNYIDKKMKGIGGCVRMGKERLQILYTSIRIFKPQIVVETGVAGGGTSHTILTAMKSNSFGKLFSIDIDDLNYDNRNSNYKIGWLVKDELRNNWNLNLGDSKKVLPKLLDDLKQIDIFFHDSDHSYEHMMFEFNTALPYLFDKKIILSDDVDLNDSFKDFSKKNNLSYESFFGFGLAKD